MQKFALALIVGALMLNGAAFADHHDGHDHDKDKHEHKLISASCHGDHDGDHGDGHDGHDGDHK